MGEKIIQIQGDIQDIFDGIDFYEKITDVKGQSYADLKAKIISDYFNDYRNRVKESSKGITKVVSVSSAVAESDENLLLSDSGNTVENMVVKMEDSGSSTVKVEHGVLLKKETSNEEIIRVERGVLLKKVGVDSNNTSNEVENSNTDDILKVEHGIILSKDVIVPVKEDISTIEVDTSPTLGGFSKFSEDEDEDESIEEKDFSEDSFYGRPRRRFISEEDESIEERNFSEDLSYRRPRRRFISEEEDTKERDFSEDSFYGRPRSRFISEEDEDTDEESRLRFPNRNDRFRRSRSRFRSNEDVNTDEEFMFRRQEHRFGSNEEDNYRLRRSRHRYDFDEDDLKRNVSHHEEQDSAKVEKSTTEKEISGRGITQNGQGSILQKSKVSEIKREETNSTAQFMTSDVKNVERSNVDSIGEVKEVLKPVNNQEVKKESYMSVRDFVKKNRGCTVDDAKKYFSSKDIKKALMSSKIVEKKGKLYVV